MVGGPLTDPMWRRMIQRTQTVPDKATSDRRGHENTHLKSQIGLDLGMVERVLVQRSAHEACKYAKTRSESTAHSHPALVHPPRSLPYEWFPAPG